MSVALIFIHLFLRQFRTRSHSLHLRISYHIKSPGTVTVHVELHSCTCTYYLFRWFSIPCTLLSRSFCSCALCVFRMHQLLMFVLFLFSPRFGSPFTIIILLDGCVTSLLIAQNVSNKLRSSSNLHLQFAIRSLICVFYYLCVYGAFFYIFNIILHLATNNMLTSPCHLIWFMCRCVCVCALFALSLSLSSGIFIICLHIAVVKHLYVCTC